MIPGIQLGEYGGEALFFLGVAWRLGTWLARTSSELQANGDQGLFGAALSQPRAMPTPLESVAALAPSMTPEQQARVIAMISEQPPATAAPELQHRCPKCGTLIHADIVHGGFSPCRKCGWKQDQN
jgi:hypothetical protein